MESALRIPDDPNFRLIETFGFHPGQVIPRLDLHLNRMARSASHFGIPFDRAGTKAKLQQIQSDTALRFRLTLDASGTTDLTSAPLPPNKPWRIAIAPQRLNSQDPWLAHKTTRRALYDQARATLPEGIDELLFLNELGELCEGTITNLFIETNGTKLTPDLTCGLLPGVLRASLLATDEYQTARLTRAHLAEAQTIYMGNSLRGLIPCTLIS